MEQIARPESYGNPLSPPDSLSTGRGRSSHALAVIQAVFVLCVVIGLIAVPPASGRMLLVPLGAEGRNDVARLAVNAGARLVASGKFDGSLVVSGEGAPLIAALLPRHILVLSATIGGCGERVPGQ